MERVDLIFAKVTGNWRMPDDGDRAIQWVPCEGYREFYGRQGEGGGFRKAKTRGEKSSRWLASLGKSFPHWIS